MTHVMVRPEMLRWAYERAGFELDELAQRIPQLPARESGMKQPTLKQLEGFAKATHTPVGYLLLSKPPVEKIPVPDFRTLAGRAVCRPTPDLLDTLYLCQQRQTWYRDFVRSMGDSPLTFVGSARITDDAIETAAKIRQTLAFNIEERRRLPTWTDALRRFVEQADAMGILVMVSGVVGSNNRRKLDPKEFRGFALSDELAPLIFINGADTKAAQMFTVAHELAHIWIGQSALSDAQASAIPDHAIENWCNRVAAELLVPLEAVQSVYERQSDLYPEMERLSRYFKVSTLVILRRMHDAGGLNRDEFWKAYNIELKRVSGMPRGSGGNFYLTLSARAGKRFARALVVSTLDGRSSFTEAFRLLGFKKMATFRELGNHLGMVV